MSRRPRAWTYTHSELVMPAHINSLGVMHGGHMTSWMDKAAWVVATRAVSAEQTVLFKAATDLVWEAPVRAGEVCSVTARIVAVGDASIRVALRARAEDPAQKLTRPVCRATFTMVTTEDGAPAPVRLHPPGDGP